ncbi:MAG: preprotein translocase subunit SecY, partial [Pseudobutyrivibrio sp.]|nr:preprotein translocase subunit SecY [Pseudobutyrivibrio sp.]
SGDSITGLRAGKKTKSYISKRVLIISIFSATFMGLFLGMPLVLQLNGMVPKDVMSLPSIMIALASINCNLYRELRAVKNYDGYVPFI